MPLTTPLNSLLKTFVNTESNALPPEKSESVMVSESLMMELDYQIRELEQLRYEKEQEHKKQVTGVDYTWLITQPSKPKYEIPQVERLELEELCAKVKPVECGKVITMFRETLVREPPVHDIPRFLRCVINQVIDTRVPEETTTIPEWLTKSFSKLRPTSSKVTPITSEIEMNSSDTVSTISYIQDSSSSTDTEEADQRVFTRVENLPV